MSNLLLCMYAQDTVGLGLLKAKVKELISTSDLSMWYRNETNALRFLLQMLYFNICATR